jgi:hypothetical protein
MKLCDVIQVSLEDLDEVGQTFVGSILFKESLEDFKFLSIPDSRFVISDSDNLAISSGVFRFVVSDPGE